MQRLALHAYHTAMAAFYGKIIFLALVLIKIHDIYFHGKDKACINHFVIIILI